MEHSVSGSTRLLPEGALILRSYSCLYGPRLRRSKYQNTGNFPKAVRMVPCAETQSPHCIGTVPAWALPQLGTATAVSTQAGNLAKDVTVPTLKQADRP